MKITPNYNNDAFIVPAEANNHLKDASKTDIIILLYMLSKKDFTLSKACEELNIEENEFVDAINFWSERGIISGKKNISSVSKKEPETEDIAKKKASSHLLRSSLPQLTSPEAAKLLERNKKIAKTIHECEKIFGKSFSPAECNTVINLFSYLNLSPEYICLLFQYAKAADGANMRFIETTALNLIDSGITTYDALAEELSEREIVRDSYPFIRKLFGFGKRSFVQKEKDKFKEWYVSWKYDDAIVARAFEAAADAITNPTVSYVHSILSDWHDNNLKTADEIEKYIQSRKAEKKKPAKKGQKPIETKSFDTSDFFEAALERSYSSGKKSDK